jgi:hypothetical protein
MAKGKTTLSAQVAKALRITPKRCPIALAPSKKATVLTVPRELRGLVALHNRLVHRRDRVQRRKATYADAERPRTIEFILLDSLRAGGHCPKHTTAVVFHRYWKFVAC